MHEHTKLGPIDLELHVIRSVRSRRLRLLSILVAVAIGSIMAALFLDVIRLPVGLVHTDITMSAVITSGQLKVSGQTTLPDGARIECAIWHESEESDSGTGAYTDGKSVTVASGEFECDFDVLGWPAGTVTSDVEFHVIPTFLREGADRGGDNARLSADGGDVDR